MADMKRLLAIGFIWLGCAIAWMVLGSTIALRGGDQSSLLNEDVTLLWGPPMVQHPPRAMLEPKMTAEIEEEPSDMVGPPNEPTEVEPAAHAIALDASAIDVNLELEQRKKGLLWFATYAVDFSARYTFRNDSDQDGIVSLQFPLAGGSVIYDAFKVLDADGAPVDASIANGDAAWKQAFSAGESHSFSVVYRSRGTESWRYAAPGASSKVKDFALSMKVNSPGVDFPAGTISPSSHSVEAGSWTGAWTFDSLVTSAPIGVELPRLLNPGPLAAKVTFFAPVSLLFFFFVVAILAAARRKDIHPMNYFLLGSAFFAFHLLFAYLVDHVAVTPAFLASAVVSVALVTSYARLFVGWRFALMEIGGAQLIYLVLFSYTFFWKGFTGLAVTIGAIITLFVIMQITGKIDWATTGLWKKPDPTPPGAPGATAPAS
jgi:hypothetical protein